MLGLAGRTVFVAGAAGAIGRAVSETLARCGADPVLHGHGSSAAVTVLATELSERYGVRARAVHGDVTEPAQLEQVRERLTAGGVSALHALVNCTTGFDGRPVDVAGLPVKEFRRVVDVDLVGSFVLVQELLPLLTAARGARVVLFSSLAGERGRPGAAHLCAAKAGVTGLALGLQRDLAPHGVTVHVVAPGPVGHHPMLTGVPISTADEVAGVVALLASPLGDPIGGQAHLVPGTLPAPAQPPS
jgi:gluconate 5-dehydrogenase/3-oxoacyl-[acyl-carrier protein] reductase